MGPELLDKRWVEEAEEEFEAHQSYIAQIAQTPSALSRNDP
jgi:hypothetical protein